jgi:CxxC motif-containing protein (DUF1111 family)
MRPVYQFTKPAYGPLGDDLLVSPRVAPAVIGMGLLEAISENDLLAWADPEDADGDGISGRVNRVWDAKNGATAIGRFGWKANQPSVEQQVAGAFNGDMGITSPLFPKEDLPARESTLLVKYQSGGEPEIDASHIADVTFYCQTLAVPARRDLDNPIALRGEKLFAEIGCATCHLPSVQTGAHELSEVAHQTIRPYTDLLLHDMGPELADGRPDFEADGQEWRTPPLWGIGLVETVNKHTRFLHDGRARSLEEAILWHGGEGEKSKEEYTQLSKANRDAVLAFLESL